MNLSDRGMIFSTMQFSKCYPVEQDRVKLPRILENQYIVIHYFEVLGWTRQNHSLKICFTYLTDMLLRSIPLLYLNTFQPPCTNNIFSLTNILIVEVVGSLGTSLSIYREKFSQLRESFFAINKLS